MRFGTVFNTPLHVCNRYRAQNGVDKKSINKFSKERVQETLLPIMEALFKLPGKGPVEGTDEWIRRQSQNIDRVSFYHMTKYPSLLKAYIKREIGSPSTDDQGFPILNKGEDVPDGTYTRLDPAQRLPTHSLSKYV